MSALKAEPGRPSRSPRWGCGASPRGASPMATTASISISASARRMASSADRPASWLSPRPIQLKAAEAAPSVTRRREKTSSGLAGPGVSMTNSLKPVLARESQAICEREQDRQGLMHYTLWVRRHHNFKPLGSAGRKPWVERVAQGIAKHVDRHQQTDQHQPRK